MIINVRTWFQKLTRPLTCSNSVTTLTCIYLQLHSCNKQLKPINPLGCLRRESTQEFQRKRLRTAPLLKLRTLFWIVFWIRKQCLDYISNWAATHLVNVIYQIAVGSWKSICVWKCMSTSQTHLHFTLRSPSCTGEGICETSLVHIVRSMAAGAT
jgi:hypothetical protein